jgi:hypothetical protein
MNQQAIFVPFLALMLQTLLVWLYMYSRRIPFIVGSALRPEQLTASELARLSPPAVSNPSDNLKNLFEIPTLFYGLSLYLFVTHRVDGAFVAAAWVFVAFRALHSLVHCTFNHVPLRFALYVISTISFWFMLARAAIGVLT